MTPPAPDHPAIEHPAIEHTALEPFGHVIVIGASTTVVRLVEELERAGEEVVVLISEPVEPDVVAELTDVGGVVITSRYLRTAELLRVGVRRAKAVVVFGSDDVFIVRTALLVEELNPDARLVLEMSTPSLGARLPRLLGDCAVLSSADLAAPFFVSAALETADTSTFEFADRMVVAGPRSRVGGEQLLVLGDTSKSGLASLLPDTGGDIVLGTEVADTDTSAVRTSGMFGVVGYLFDRKVRAVLLGVVALMIISAVYFKLTGLDWLTALFLALTTSTATGLGDVSSLSVGFRIGAVVIAFFGLLLSAGVTAVIIDALISARLAAVTGGVRGRPSNHVVVCGLGRVGMSVCTRLRARGVPVVSGAPGERHRSAAGTADEDPGDHCRGQ